LAGRDEFSTAIKSALALRAGYRCSLCDGATVGPSDEAPTKASNVGTAAHICAAARGGPRYDAAMTPAERTDIANGIWLCANHGRLIDTDVVQYTVTLLRDAKQVHERRCQQGLAATNASAPAAGQHLVAIGPDIVAVGDIDQVQGHLWRVRIDHFVHGAFADLVGLAGQLGLRSPGDRYLIVNSLGEGRTIKGDFAIARDGAQILVNCEVSPAFLRTQAQNLAKDFSISAKYDLSSENGSIATVSGLDALPQRLLSCLSMRVGESPFHGDFGSRLADIWTNYLGSPWLDELFKLDVIRLASIPYADPILATAYTPLQSVERVDRVTVVGELEGRRLPVRLDLQVAGVGAWSRTLAVHIG
jgi:hypothetical protein